MGRPSRIRFISNRISNTNIQSSCICRQSFRECRGCITSASPSIDKIITNIARPIFSVERAEMAVSLPIYDDLKLLRITNNAILLILAGRTLHIAI